jgi:hypothetical protein
MGDCGIMKKTTAYAVALAVFFSTVCFADEQKNTDPPRLTEDQIRRIEADLAKDRRSRRFEMTPRAEAMDLRNAPIVVAPIMVPSNVPQPSLELKQVVDEQSKVIRELNAKVLSLEERIGALEKNK